MITSEGDPCSICGLECVPGQVFHEGDILARPKMESDFNRDPDNISMILRPVPGYTDVVSLVGRWQRSSLQRSSLQTIRKDVNKKVIII